MVKKLLIYLFAAILLVCAAILVVSFFINIPQWLSITASVIVIVMCGLMLYFTRDKSKGDKK